MKSFKWTVEFTVSEVWVADGFDLTEERVLEMLADELGYAHGHEIAARVLKAPDPEEIAIVQGYKNAAEMFRKNPSQYGRV